MEMKRVSSQRSFYTLKVCFLIKQLVLSEPQMVVAKACEVKQTIKKL